jgi:hypothetical protein
MSDERIPMWCEACRQSDTDPRHHVLQADGSVQTMHMDCCRESGKCVEDHCHKTLLASGEKRGDELLGWIQSYNLVKEGE